jgi:DNA-binding NtrC family response regulator
MPRILIVDDDHETCRFMADLLERPGREIESAYDPTTALALVKTRLFDLVISDINLNAEQSGLDILRAFRESSPRGHVLLISGFGTLETAIDAVRAGAFDYISKPFDINEVKATVERALERRASRPGARALARRPPAGAARADGADARRL